MVKRLATLPSLKYHFPGLAEGLKWQSLLDKCKNLSSNPPAPCDNSNNNDSTKYHCLCLVSVQRARLSVIVCDVGTIVIATERSL
jgi:hypothetical protein